MDELNQALTEIATIRGQMARAVEFRGYGPATLVGTAALAGVTGVAQALWVPHPLETPGLYASLWSMAAAAAAGMIAVETIARTRRIHRGLADDMIRAALEQFLPAALAGLLLTIVLLRVAPADAGLLPGLWQIVFSLGVFATCRILPRATLAVAGWYLFTGLVCVAGARGGYALSPWMMTVPYAVGQTLTAAILWRTSMRAAAVEVNDEAL
ncbi:MAG TPA: hypothetical protein VKG84_09470 [Candidatus Acidoferrales bacterium]|nr:hypothetical protein [Candidatus Acidoferrales bacterium]